MGEEGFRFIDYIQLIKNMKEAKIFDEEKILKVFNNNYFIFLYGQFREEAFEKYVNILNPLKLKRILLSITDLTEEEANKVIDIILWDYWEAFKRWYDDDMPINIYK